MEEPFFFDADGFRLLAIAHRPEGARADVAVVVCHPYGEEKQLSYPVLVRAARLLAGDGFPVLRFDHRGHGDSQGNTEDATIASGIAETLAAVRLARERFGVDGVVLLGLRLGGAIAVRAAEREPAIAGLVLWSPIVKGPQYVDELLRKRLFADMLGKRRSSRAQIVEALSRDGRVEIEGNFLGRQMSEELAAVDLQEEIAGFRRPVLVSGVKSLAQSHAAWEAVARAYEARGAPATFEIAGTQAFWERSAMYDRYVPEDLLDLTRRWMRAGWGGRT